MQCQGVCFLLTSPIVVLRNMQPLSFLLCIVLVTEGTATHVVETACGASGNTKPGSGRWLGSDMLCTFPKEPSLVAEVGTGRITLMIVVQHPIEEMLCTSLCSCGNSTLHP